MTQGQISAGQEAPPRRSPGSWLAVALAVLATAGFFVSARANSWFFSDDYIAFHLAATRSFDDFLLSPIDVHFLPLHRLATWSIFTFFGLDFDVALLVMAGFHLAGVWLLYRTLQLLGESAIHAPLVVLYAASYYAAISLTWWTVGIARFPYVVLALVAIHQFLKFRADGRPWRIAAIVAALVGAAAFFTKALLLPGVLVALELALLPGTGGRRVLRNAAVVLIAGLAAVAYYYAGMSYGVDALRTPPFDWKLQKTALDIVVAKVPQSFLGLSPAQPLSVLNWLVVAAWAAFLGFSIWRSRFNVVVWLLGAGVVLANFLVITLSQRMGFGPGIVANDRYYFEILYLLVLFVALISHRAGIAPSWNGGRSNRLALGGLWLVTIAVAMHCQMTFVDAFGSARYKDLRAARVFGHNLTRELAELRRTNQRTLRFADGLVPLDVLRIAAMEIRTYSEVLPLFDANVTVGGKGACLFRIRDDGTIVKPAPPCPQAPPAAGEPERSPRG